MKTISGPLVSEPSYKLPKSSKRRRFSPFMLIGIGVTVLIVIAAGFFTVVRPFILSHAATPNQNCTLTVPANPLSAQGLATPYQFAATDAAQGPCNEANAAQSAFVQAVIYDPATGNMSVYEPLVIDQGTQPAAAPVVPTLPAGAVVGLSFGFNANNLMLQGAQAAANCVNGLNGSLFTQFAYCNTPALFTAINQGITAGLVKVPALATAKDGLPCPTTRDFGIIDQDQSDNVQTQYLANAKGQTAQFSAANQAAMANATLIANPSDNALLTRFVDPALGCQAWTHPDLANGNAMVAAMSTDEIQAQVDQKAPIALVPLTDPMTEIADANGNLTQSLTKTNLYRAGVDQTQAQTTNDASGTTYCQNFLNTGIPRIQLDQPLTINAASPAPTAANSLFTFLAMRANQSYTNLNCQNLLNKPNPVTLTTDANGVVTSATIMGMTSPTGGTTPNCNVDGTLVAGCVGNATINGQTCTLSFANNTVNVTCPNAPGNTGGNPTPLTFNNVGVSNDQNVAAANFDGGGASYSAQALQNVGITPGKTITFNGVTFTWPNVTVPGADNVVAKGQVVPLTPVQGATTLGFLGSSSAGPSFGNATITYTDGTTQTFQMLFSDWTLNGGRSLPSAGNQVVAEMPYRNTLQGMQDHHPHIFYIDVALMTGKTVQSITLPSTVNQGRIHVFAIGTK